MTRPSAEQRRLDYLDVGASIVSEFDEETAAAATVEALANVRLSDVAARAGVTKGAVYHLWPSQEAYRQDLLARLLEQQRQRGVRELPDLIAAAASTGDPRELLHLFARFAFDALKDDPAFFARFSFFLYATNPAVADLLARGDDAVIEDFTPLVEQYLAAIGRRMRPPFTVGMLITATTALFHGLCLRYRSSPDLVDGTVLDDADGPGMYGVGLEALLEHFSEPVPGTGAAQSADGSS